MSGGTFWGGDILGGDTVHYDNGMGLAWETNHGKILPKEFLPQKTINLCTHVVSQSELEPTVPQRGRGHQTAELLKFSPPKNELVDVCACALIMRRIPCVAPFNASKKRRTR